MSPQLKRFFSTVTSIIYGEGGGGVWINVAPEGCCVKNSSNSSAAIPWRVVATANSISSTWTWKMPLKFLFTHFFFSGETSEWRWEQVIPWLIQGTLQALRPFSQEVPPTNAANARGCPCSSTASEAANIYLHITIYELYVSLMPWIIPSRSDAPVPRRVISLTRGICASAPLRSVLACSGFETTCSFSLLTLAQTLTNFSTAKKEKNQ